MNKFEVGQKVWTLNVNNVARGVDSELTEREVVRVGRKYFYLNDYGAEIKFDIHTLEEFTGYMSDYKVYLDPQDLEDEKESRDILSKIESILYPQFRRSGVSLDKLRVIAKILEIEES
jgi:hypothetical protein